MRLAYVGLCGVVLASPAFASLATELLVRLDLTPRVLAASGVTVAECTQMLSTAASVQGAAEIRQLDSQIATLNSTVAQQTEAVRLAPEDQSLAQQLANSQAQLNDARASLLALETATVNTLLEPLTGSKRDLASRARTHTQIRSGAEFWGLELTADQWGELQRFLVAEARASRLGTTLPEAVTQRLAQLRASAEVISAVQNLEANLAGITAAFAGG